MSRLLYTDEEKNLLFLTEKQGFGKKGEREREGEQNKLPLIESEKEEKE